MDLLNVILVGVVVGGAYALVALSVTLMLRTTGVLSFAHAAFAMVAAFVYTELVRDRGWPGPAAAVIALLITGAYGLVVERVAIRPVATASASMKLISTIGVLSFTTGVILLRYGFAPSAAPSLFPDRTFALGSLRISYQETAIFGFAVACALGLAAFLRRTRFGLAVRAVAQNREVARLMGVSPAAIARFNWGLGALLAGLAGVLIAPLTSLSPGTFPLILIKALTASLFGGLVSLPLTFVGGLIVGVVQSVTRFWASAPGTQELATAVMVVALLLVRRSWPQEISDVSGVPRRPRAPVALEGLLRGGRRLSASARALAWPIALVGLPLLVLAPARSNYWGFVGGLALFYLIEALSMVLLVGWGGQVSLMHGAYVGIGALLTASLVQAHGLPVEAALPLAGLAGMAMGGVVGIPALRLSGLQFGIASLAFASAASEWLFRRPVFRQQLPRGTLFGLDLGSDSTVFLVMLGFAVLAYLVVWNVRRSTFWALSIAARDMGDTFGHFGADPRRYRMSIFLLASFIASVGGGLYGVLLTGFSPNDFSTLLSISLLLYAMIGGVSSLAGPVVTALAFGVLPQVLQRQAGAQASAWPDIISGAAVVALVALRPQGLASLFSSRQADAQARGRVRAGGRFEAVLGRYARASSNGHGARAASVGRAADVEGSSV